MLRRLILLPLLVFSLPVQAQEEAKYRVHFSDKEGVRFDPHAYFSRAAIERRRSHGIPLKQFSDRPLKASYVKRVRCIAGSILSKSRWFNMVYVRMDGGERDRIASLDCVEKLERVRSYPCLSSRPGGFFPVTGKKELMKGQTQSLGIEAFRERGLTGKGIRIAVIDNGYEHVDTNPVFDHLRKREKILRTKDFVEGERDVYDDGSHGTGVLSCIAGITEDSVPLGLAPDAEFLLARTERTLWELPSEEENWLASVEWADRHGARILNSSLGYRFLRYFREEMDGTSYLARAANLAARKGILVVSSAGNAGSSRWQIVATPADADSALTVGSVRPEDWFPFRFSSSGPTVDREMKPNLCAYGKVVIPDGAQGLQRARGTSYSSPLVAGFAACALQSDTTMRTMELFERLEGSGHLHPYFDYIQGYGLPQARSFFERGSEGAATFKVKRMADSIFVKIEPEAMPSKPLKGNVQPKRDHLFYHVSDTTGMLEEYGLIEVDRRTVLRNHRKLLEGGKKMRVFYRGYTRTIE